MVVLRGQDNWLPPRRMICDFTMSHDRFGRSPLHLSWEDHTRLSDGAPDPDPGVLQNVTRDKILYYRRLYVDRPHPIVFMSITVRTSGHLFHDFIRLSFLYVHRESSVLVRGFLKNSDQFRFLSVSVVCLHNLKGSVGLITKMHRRK